MHRETIVHYLSLTPAYQRWCMHAPSESRDLASYTAHLARVDHLLCYLSILYPTFVSVDDLILRADALPDDWNAFMSQARAAHWSPRQIEYIINHLHVCDVFLNDPDYDAIPLEVYGFLADVIADLRRKRLQDAFPRRRFEVGVTERDASPEVYAVQA